MLGERNGHFKHGWRRTLEYKAYQNAKQRCTNPANKDFPDYGGRGIEFHFRSFEEFLAAVGPKPDPALTLDRIDNDGHYEASNCRWATRSEQRHNQRSSFECLLSNVLVEPWKVLARAAARECGA